MNELEKFVRDVLNDKVQERIGTTMQVDTMADMLLEDERNNGTYTYPIILYAYKINKPVIISDS